MFRLSDIATVTGGELVGDPKIVLEAIASLQDAKTGSLSFVLEKKYVAAAEISAASAFVTSELLPAHIPHVLVKHSREALAQVITWWAAQSSQTQRTISDRATIDPTSKIGSNVSIGPGCVVGAFCTIGHDVTLHANVTLYDHVTLGDRVVVHSGVVLGADGFGYYQKDGRHNKIPHIGQTILESDVEVGANTTIDRGCLGETRIGTGTKIDNLVQIGHNVQIGKCCIITAQVGIIGSTQIGDYVMVGGQAGISSVKIGNRAVIAAKSGVTKDVPEGAFFSGFPAQPHRQELTDQARLKRLIKQSKRSLS